MQPRNRGARPHWHPASERYTTGDRLEAATYNGWKIRKIDARRHVLGSGRHVIVYYLELERNHETAKMRLVSTPFIEKYLAQALRLLLRTELKVVNVG
jgi:hypothetical protein